PLNFSGRGCVSSGVSRGMCLGSGTVMKTWKKVVIGAGAALVVAGIVAFAVYQSRKNVVTVQTGRVQMGDLAAVVSGSGEIKPKTYVNVSANAFGKITKLFVREGDRG